MINITLLVLALSGPVSCDAAEQSAPAGQKAARVELRWLGTAGWEIGDGATVILVDPYISRLFGPQPPGRAPFAQTPGDTRPVYGWDDIAKPDTAAIDARISQAHFILVTHAHYDHDLDVSYIALKHRATMIGTESTVNIMRAYAVPEEQLVTVRGGEDYDFGAFSVRVIPSLHSPLDRMRPKIRVVAS